MKKDEIEFVSKELRKAIEFTIVVFIVVLWLLIMF